MRISRATFRGLCRARDRLHDLDDAATIPQLARDAAISPYHFIRQFDAVFGATPRQFRIARRIARAKQLLASGELSVTEVCLEVGCSSLGTFSDLFRREVGVSPSAYRRVQVQVPAVQRTPTCLELLAWLPAEAFAISKKQSPRALA